jgi:hypothetical protein
MLRPRLGFLAVALVVSGPGVLAQGGAVDFGRDVRPLLADRCFACHGPDEKTRKAGLRLDLREGATGRLRGGRRAVVPGDAEGSELVRRILHADPDERMPPAEAGKELAEAERALLVRWIEEGAVWEEHWAFQPVVERPLPPPGAHAARERNFIDRFVFARLEREGLAPAPEADRATLIRRLCLDLTGLPPTPDEVQAFVGDEAPDAYEALVERLLGGERHAEHMARYWLDAARYGDTHGLHLDNYREMWPFRDHVIRAFEQNQPYDHFVVEQLAGDLLPGATLEQQIATGFVRAHVTTSEGGSIEEEVYVRNVVDRVDTFGTVFLGLTVGCAACHDHKFDPIAQRDYYRLFAFLNNEDGSPLDGNAKAHAPVVQVPSPEQEAERTVLEAGVAAARAELEAAVAAFEYREPPPDPAADVPAVDTVWIDDELDAVETLGAAPVWVTAPVHSGSRAMERRGEGLHQHFVADLPRKLRVGADDLLFAHVWIDPTDPPREIMLQWNGDGAGDWAHRAFWGEDLIAWGEAGTASRHAAGALPATGRYVRLDVPARALGFGPGAVVHGIAFTQHGGRAVWDAVGIRSRVVQEPEDFVWIDDELPAGAKAEGDGAKWNWQGATEAGPAPFSGARSLRRGMGARLNQDFFTGATPPLRLGRGDRLFAQVWLDPDDPPTGIQLQFHSGGSWNHRARWGGPCHGEGAGEGGDHRAGELPEAGRWVRLEVGLAEVGLAPGAAIDGWAFTQTGGTLHWDRAGVRTYAQHDDRHLWSLAAWTGLAAVDQALPAPVREAAAAAEPSEAQRQLLRDHFVRHVHAGSRELVAPLQARLDEAEKQRRELDARIPTTLVMRERAEPRPAFVLRRGEYDQRGEAVERGTPAFLPPMDAALPRDRLGLARWLVDPRHPLTARVAVNRFWQQVFGVGLVRTAEDFGNQGEPPSHPALLDELARRFVAGGWDVRALMRELVLSATYRQASSAAPEAFARDPQNRLLARGPRHRLDAEVIRDSALAVAGLLVEQVGGPGVKPPQPPGLWEAVAYVGSNTMRFEADRGADKVHRRSLYTFWKRTAPPPQMSIFDAPNRESCRVRRERTNTPLQALLLMNDPQFVECARAFAERILRRPGDEDARIDWAFVAATGRHATAADRADLLALVEEQRAAFAAAPERAAELVRIGELPPDPSVPAVELAAWTVAANLLLNLDDFVTKG